MVQVGGIALDSKRKRGGNETLVNMAVHSNFKCLLGVVKLSTPPVGIGIAIRQCPSLYVRSTPCSCGACGAGLFPRHIASLKPHGRKRHATDTHLNIYIYKYTRAPHVTWASPHRQHHARHGTAAKAVHTTWNANMRNMMHAWTARHDKV